LAPAVHPAEREGTVVELDRADDALLPEPTLHPAREAGPIRQRKEALKAGHQARLSDENPWRQGRDGRERRAAMRPASTPATGREP
jgi:hypothetical protein